MIVDNSLGGVHGVYVRGSSGPVSVDGNRFRATYGIRVARSTLCPDGSVSAHRNTFVSDSYAADTPYGTWNQDDDVVNATNNYWGAEDGPSSPEGVTVTDPVTGEPADGSGRPVSDGVHFDPWRSEPVAGTNATG